MNETAILLTGLIRLHNDELKHHWNVLKKSLKKFDVFVCTYKEFLDNAREIAPDENIYIIDEVIDRYINDPVHTEKLKANFFQVIQLEESLKHFENKISKFKHFIRIRNDLYWGLGDVEACFEEIIDASEEGYSTCFFDFMYGGPVNKWLQHAKEERIKKHTLKEKHMFDTPFDYHNYLKTLEISAQSSKSYNTAFWQFPHDIDLMYELNKKYNFKIQEGMLEYFCQGESKTVKCIKFIPKNNKQHQKAKEFLTEICNIKIKEESKPTDYTKWGTYYNIDLSPLNPGPLLLFWVLGTGPVIYRRANIFYSKKKRKFVTLIEARHK